MLKTLKNNTAETGTWCGVSIPSNETYTIQPHEDEKFQENEEIVTSISNGDLIVGDGGREFSAAIGLEWLKMLRNHDKGYTWAADRNGTDLELSGNDWATVVATRVLWDTDGEFDELSEFEIDQNGIYNFDVQLKLKSLVNVTAIELALWKKVPNESDDYWFILNRCNIPSGDTEIQLAGATSFDFRAGEIYYLAIKLYGTNPTASIDGSDDYSAWGATWTSPLIAE